MVIYKAGSKSAWEHTNKADLALVLESSLRVARTRAMPGQVARNGGRLVVANLQRTHFDGKASLICDRLSSFLVSVIRVT